MIKEYKEYINCVFHNAYGHIKRFVGLTIVVVI